MTEQSRSLTELVRFFKIGDTPAREASAAQAGASQKKHGGAAKPRAKPDEAGDKHAGQPMFSTRRPPPPQPSHDGDWKEF